MPIWIADLSRAEANAADVSRTTVLARVEHARLNRVIEKSFTQPYSYKSFNDWGGRGYDGSVPGEVTKAAPSGKRTIWSP